MPDINKMTVNGTEYGIEDTTAREMASDCSNAIKVTAIDEIIQIDDVSTADHYIETRIVNKNLIPYPYSSTTNTVSGITFTDNGDGTITANGTSTGHAFFNVLWNEDAFPLEPGTYTFSGTAPGSSADKYYMYAANDYNTTYHDYGDGKTFTLTEKSDIRVFIFINTGVTVNNITFKPMLVKGDTPGVYTPYVNPSDVTVTRLGKNVTYLPNNEKQITYPDGLDINCKVVDGEITIKGTFVTGVAKQKVIYPDLTFTGVNYPSYAKIAEVRAVKIPRGSYYIKFNQNRNDARLIVGPIDGSHTGGTALMFNVDGSFEVTEDNLYAMFVVSPYDESGTISKYYYRAKPQLERIKTDGGPTDFVPPVVAETFKFDENGIAKVKSTSPTTIIFADDPSVKLEVGYNKDIRKYISEQGIGDSGFDATAREMAVNAQYEAADAKTVALEARSIASEVFSMAENAQYGVDSLGTSIGILRNNVSALDTYVDDVANDLYTQLDSKQSSDAVYTMIGVVLEERIGDIDAALDNILEMDEELLGGDA